MDIIDITVLIILVLNVLFVIAAIGEYIRLTKKK